MLIAATTLKKIRSEYPNTGASKIAGEAFTCVPDAKYIADIDDDDDDDDES